MIYTQIITRAKRICHQPAGKDEGHWLDSEWLEALNEIHLELVDETEAIIVKDTDTVKDQDYVDMPSTIIRPTIVYLGDNLLKYKDPRHLAFVDEDWPGATSDKPSYYYFSDGKINFNCPCDDAYDMVIFGTKRVTDMSSDQSDPFEGYGYLRPYHRLLIHGLCMEFFSDTGDKEDEDRYTIKWEQGKAKMKHLTHSGAAEGDLRLEQFPKTYVDEVN